MPLLSLEPFVFPETLLQPGPKVEAGEKPWRVLFTRPRMEKNLVRRLLAREISFFLPLYEHRLPSQGRVRSSYLPLFPSYVFLKGDHQDRQNALETNLVSHCIEVADQGQIQEDLERVYQAVTSVLELTPEARLQPGTPVRVIAGPLAGLEGTVLRRGKQLKFQIAMRFLQQGVSVEMEHWMIEPIDEPFRTKERQG